MNYDYSLFIYEYSILIMNIQKCLFCPLLLAIFVTTYHQIQIMSAPLEMVKGDRQPVCMKIGDKKLKKSSAVFGKRWRIKKKFLLF